MHIKFLSICTFQFFSKDSFLLLVYASNYKNIVQYDYFD
jgi:hypothetical protein